MRNDLIIFLLVGVVVLAGCIGQTRAPVAGAITATLTVDSTSVPSGTPLGITISVTNGALSPIRTVEASLFGPSGWTVRKDTSDFPLIETNTKKTTTTIYPTSTWEPIWIVKAPSVGVDTPYTIFGKVKYDASNNRSVTATVVNYNYYKRTKTPSSVTPSAAESGGPISISFGTVSQQLFAFDSAPVVFPLKIIVTNVGSGKAYVGTPTLGSGLNQVKGKVLRVSGLSLSNCEPNIAATGGAVIDLVKDGTTGFATCDVTVSGVTDITTATLEVAVEYSYIQDLKSPTITVQKSITAGG